MTNAVYRLYDVVKSERYLCSKCCFCIPLKIWCFMLGYISLFFNILVTLCFIMGLVSLMKLTNGFQYLHLKQTQDGSLVLDEDETDKARLRRVIISAACIGSVNIMWVILTTILLIGLHLKKPKHIKAHVVIATVRILITLGLRLTIDFRRSTANDWIEVGCSAYFVLIYYSYAKHLERSRRHKEIVGIQTSINELVLYSKDNEINAIGSKESKGEIITSTDV